MKKADNPTTTKMAKNHKQALHIHIDIYIPCQNGQWACGHVNCENSMLACEIEHMKGAQTN